MTPSQRWETALEEMSLSTSTTYKRELKEFLDWATETPEGLLGYWIETQDMSLSDHVKDYVKELTKRGHRGGKQNSVIKAIKKFFKVNGYAPVFDVKNMMGNGGVRPAKPDEIREVLRFSITNPRDASLIAISKDSGLRVSDITRIQFHHIQPIIDDPELTFFGFQIPVHKTRNKSRKALPCLGPEAIYHLRAWLKKRATLGLTSDTEDYVFVTIRDVQEYKAKGKTRKESVIGARMDDKNASVAIGKLFKRAGFNDLSANSLRKFNTTALSMAGMGENLIKVMHGKHQQSSIDHYLKATANQMLEVYQEHYDKLSVEGAVYVDQQQAKIEELQTQIDDIMKFINVKKNLEDLVQDMKDDNYTGEK